jgi:hypothetical protein
MTTSICMWAPLVGDPNGMRNRWSPADPHGDRFGRGGSVALRLSTDRDIGWPVKAQAGELSNQVFRDLTLRDLNNKLVFAVLWYYAPEQLPCLDLRYGMDRRDAKTNPKGYRGAYRQHEDTLGYDLEYAIPWTLLNADSDPPQAGDELACTINAHFSGPEGKVWHGNLLDVTNPAVKEWEFMDAETWGKMLYLPPESPGTDAKP